VKAKSELRAHRVSAHFRNVWLLAGDDDRCRAEEFLCGLEFADFTKILVVLSRVDANVAYRHAERFKRLSPSVFEFKTHRHRLLCFRTDRGFVCTDGMKKQKSSRSRVSDAAVESAERLSRRFAKEGTYVE